MSKLIKSAVKAPFKVAKKFHKVTNGLRKKVSREFRRFAKTTVGKIVIAAVLIYFGGAFMGAWAGPGGAAGGAAGAGAGAGAGGGAAFGGGAAAATSTAGVGTVLAPTVTSGSLMSGALATAFPAAAPVGTGTFLAAGGAAAGGAATGGAGLAAAGAQATEAVAAGGGFAGAQSAGGIVGTIKSLGSSALQFAKDNPTLAFLGTTMAGQLMAPTAQQEQFRYNEKERAALNERMDGVGEIDTGLSLSGRPLVTQQGRRVWNDEGGLVANFRTRLRDNSTMAPAPGTT